MLETAPRNHILVVGHGRSGTNMVLDLFDYHRNTFCRNEPNELLGTAFTGLGDPLFSDIATADFTPAWRQALEHTFRSSGARDRFGVAKDYFRSALHARLGQSAMASSKVRKLIVPRIGGQSAQEWRTPTLYYNPTALAKATPVLKMLLTPAWVIHAHGQFTTQKVVHVIRNPHDFIQSWWSRYVGAVIGGAERVFADNQPSLARILHHYRQKYDPAAAYSPANLVISELWRWRYINEVMLADLSGSKRYLLAPYKSVMQDKLAWAEQLYDFAGLKMSAPCAGSIGTMKNKLFAPRKDLGIDPELVKAAIENVLADSPYRDQLCGIGTA